MMDFLEQVAGWFGRLLDGVNPDSGATGVGVLALGLLLAVVGIAWVRRISNPGPLARGDAKWRYRDRGRRERITMALETPIAPDRTAGWWLTRIEFGIAIGLPVVVAWLLISEPRHMVGGSWPVTLPTTLAGFAGIAVGLAWMIRIYRAGLRNDAEATWRHRDGRS
jgi:hypothetical protein